MNDSTLSLFWDCWRKDRFHEFIHGEMKRSSADECSRAEAAARQQVERQTNLSVALAAELAVVPDKHGEDRMILLVPPELIQPDRRRDAKLALHVKGIAVRL